MSGYSWRHTGGGNIVDDRGVSLGTFIGDFRNRDRLICAVNEVEVLREQVAALAEQNKKLRKTLDSVSTSSLTHPRVKDYVDKALSLPDLAAPTPLSTGDRKDAERYRWLRDVGDSTWNPISKRGITANQCDAAIDAAIQKDKP